MIQKSTKTIKANGFKNWVKVTKVKKKDKCTIGNKTILVSSSNTPKTTI